MPVEQRDYDLDLLRSIGIILVVLWHLLPIRWDVDKLTFGFNPGYLLYFFYTQFTLIAVPLFYIISIYLFYLKSNNSFPYFKKRMIRISILFIFWTSVQFMVYFIESGLSHKSISQLPTLLTLLKGGPDIPQIDGSVFYFLSNMFILSFLAFYYVKIGSNSTKVTLSYWLVGINLFYFYIMLITKHPIPYWRIDGFLIYVPAAYLLFNTKTNSPSRASILSILLLSIIFILTSAYETYLQSIYSFEHSIYGRCSIFWGALLLFKIIFLREFVVNKSIKFLSKYSLGIFATHKYWLLLSLILVSNLFGGSGYSYRYVYSGVVLDLERILTFILTILSTIISVYLLSKTPLKKVIE
jgi:hypothetical protein